MSPAIPDRPGNVVGMPPHGGGVRVPIVVGTGLIALDVVIGPDAAAPALLMAGGTCGNVLAILSYFGWGAFPVARLNGDSASQKVRRDLTHCGVDLEFATQRPPVETPVIVQTVRRDGQGLPKHRFSLVCPDCGSWYPSYRAITVAAADEVGEAIADARPSGFVPRVFFFDRVSPGAIALAERLSAAGALVVFEPAGVGDPKLLARALNVAHILKYSNDRLPDLAARRRERESVVLEIETHGEEGLRYRSSVISSAGWRTFSALTAPSLVDTAGSGDWCTAGILTKLARQGSAQIDRWSPTQLDEAVRYGQAMAALACAYLGARGAMYNLSRPTFDRAVQAILVNAPAVEVDLANKQADIRIPLNGKKNITSALCPVCP